MKKLYLLIPVTLWVTDYFVFEIAGSFIKEYPTAASIWWIFTCIFIGMATVISAGFALAKAFD